ncbi:MAG: hypothetical protein ACI85I_001529 [Arenicella sp.]
MDSLDCATMTFVFTERTEFFGDLYLIWDYVQRDGPDLKMSHQKSKTLLSVKFLKRTLPVDGKSDSTTAGRCSNYSDNSFLYDDKMRCAQRDACIYEL